MAPLSATCRTIRTPRAAAVAGIAFSMLLTIVLVIVRLAVPEAREDAGDWLEDGTKRGAVVLALNLLPFAGIPFLWFIGVVRDRIGEGEDRFFATVSGQRALVRRLALRHGRDRQRLVLTGSDFEDADVWSFGRRVNATLLGVYAMRMAAVFAISTTTIASRLGLAPRWLIALGMGPASCCWSQPACSRGSR